MHTPLRVAERNNADRSSIIGQQRVHSHNHPSSTPPTPQYEVTASVASTCPALGLSALVIRPCACHRSCFTATYRVGQRLLGRRREKHQRVETKHKPPSHVKASDAGSSISITTPSSLLVSRLCRWCAILGPSSSPVPMPSTQAQHAGEQQDNTWRTIFP